MIVVNSSGSEGITTKSYLLYKGGEKDVKIELLKKYSPLHTPSLKNPRKTTSLKPIPPVHSSPPHAIHS